jgi:Kef-type K+ transport system membrane component KefB
MSTMKSTSSNKATLKRWMTPAVGLAIGVAYLIAGFVSGNPTAGVFGFAIMALVVVGMVLASRRSETVKGLLDHQDERIATIDLKATAFAGSVIIVAILVAFVVELAQGQDGAPYSWLGALGGISYVAAVITLRLRS